MYRLLHIVETSVRYENKMQNFINFFKNVEFVGVLLPTFKVLVKPIRTWKSRLVSSYLFMYYSVNLNLRMTLRSNGNLTEVSKVLEMKLLGNILHFPQLYSERSVTE